MASSLLLHLFLPSYQAALWWCGRGQRCDGDWCPQSLDHGQDGLRHVGGIVALVLPAAQLLRQYVSGLSSRHDHKLNKVKIRTMSNQLKPMHYMFLSLWQHNASWVFGRYIFLLVFGFSMVWNVRRQNVSRHIFSLNPTLQCNTAIETAALWTAHIKQNCLKLCIYINVYLSTIRVSFLVDCPGVRFYLIFFLNFFI